jgi:hypothetical protein
VPPAEPPLAPLVPPEPDPLLPAAFPPSEALSSSLQDAAIVELTSAAHATMNPHAFLRLEFDVTKYRCTVIPEVELSPIATRLSSVSPRTVRVSTFFARAMARRAMTRALNVLAWLIRTPRLNCEAVRATPPYCLELESRGPDALQRLPKGNRRCDRRMFSGSRDLQ